MHDAQLLGASRAIMREFAQLVAFEVATGSTDVPKSWGPKAQEKFDSKEEPEWWSKELGKWVSNQRNYRKNKNACLTERRIALLDGIGFDWDPNKTA